MSEWRKYGQMAIQATADLQNQAIGWLRKGCSSLGGGMVVRFPRMWVSSGECRLNRCYVRINVMLSSMPRAVAGAVGMERMDNGTSPA